MKTQQKAQSYLAMVGIRRNQSLINVNFLIAEFLMFLSVLFSWLFLILKANNFREYTLSIFSNSTTTMTAACFTIFATEKETIFTMLDNGEKIIEKRSKERIIRAMYMDTNRTTDKLCQLAFIVMVILAPVVIIFPKAILIYFIYFTTDADNNVFDLAFPVWLPFDWKNPIGYFVAIILEYIGCLNMLLIGLSMFTLTLGGLLMGNSVTNDLKNYLVEINENSKFEENHLRIKAQLYHFVEVHTIMKQLLDELLRLIELMGMVFLAWTTIVVCVALLLIQVELSKPEINLVDLSIAIVEVFAVFLTLTIVCESGQRITDIVASFADVLEQYDWHSYSLEMQRWLLQILLNVQKPVDMRCFGSIAANRETFKKIVNGGFSYFTTLRNFSK